MDTLALRAQIRTVIGKKVATLRQTGLTPAIMYGHGTEPTALAIDNKQLTEVWHAAGSSQLVELTADGQTSVKVLIHDIQRHPVSGAILHADLYQVKMTEKLETEIPLKFVGEAPAVKDLEGTLVTEKDALEIRCLPGDLVAEFEVDLSVLTTFEDVIKVADITVPSAIEVLNDPEETIALVKAPLTEEELEAELAPSGEETEKAAIAEMESAAEAEKDEGEETSEGEEKSE